MNKRIKKIISILLLILTLFSTYFSAISSAHTNITSAYLQEIGDADYHLKYDFGDRTTYVICSIVGHYIDGAWYPAYCVNKNLQGAETSPYDVAVTQVLDNNALWRVLVNGYPYKSAESMGLSDFDAFCVTKMAVYCILGQSDVNRYVADSGDSTAVHMLNKLKELVDIGFNGSETMKRGTLSSNKVGDFTESGDYYYQEYSINSGVEISGYSITNIAGFGEGSFIANTNGGAQNSFGNGENFRIYVHKNALNSDINGNVSINARAKTYPILYGESPNADLQDYVLTSDPYGDERITVELSVSVSNGNIVINKTDDETKNPIAGVVFGLYKDGIEITRGITNESGIATFNNLYPGYYTVKEVSTAENYVLNSNDFNVEVKYNSTVTLNIENSYKRGNLKIYKVDKDNKKITISGVEFELYNKDSQKKIGTYTTGKNGEIYIQNLRIGNYRLHETKTDKWYNLTEDTNVVVEWNETTNTTIENELKKGQVKIIKVDKDNHEIKLKGVTFEVYDEQNKKVDTLKTNENGEATSKKLPINQTYTVKETITNKLYELNSTPQKITLEENQIKTLTFENEHKKGNLKVYKIDKDNNKIALGGVKFELYSEEFQKVIGNYITDQNGEIYIENLRIGDYKLHEITTNQWYNLTKDKNVVVEWNETTDTTVENELKKGQVKVIKIDKDNNEIKLEGVKFEVLDKNNNVLEIIETDKNGEALTSKYPIRDFEKLYLRECETLKNYVLNNKKVEIVLKENEIKNIEFQNEKKKGKIKVIKVDKDNNEVKLEGVTFEIFDEKNNKVDTLTTDKNGEATSKSLPIDQNYTVKETITGESYILNETPQTVTLKQDQITTLTFENEKRKGQIEIIKVDAENHEVKLEGVIFEILDKSGNIVDTVITDSEGKAVTRKLPIDNEYIVREKETRKEYVLSKDTVKVVLEENEIKSITFENVKKRGSIKILKVSNGYSELLNIEDGMPLAGAKFIIVNSNGDAVGVYETGEDGTVQIDNLVYGEYTIYEYETPNGYLRDAEPQTIFIEENGQIIDVTFKNSPIQSELPKTGYDINIDKATIFVIISALTSIVYLIKKYKKMEE